VDPKAYTIFEAPIKKKYEIRYESECLFRMRKEIATNYKSKKKADKYHKIQQNSKVFLQTNCLHPCIISFFLHFLSAYSLIINSYDKDFAMSFVMEISLFIIDSLQKFPSVSQLAIGNVM
jgi:hypothetical protein